MKKISQGLISIAPDELLLEEQWNEIRSMLALVAFASKSIKDDELQSSIAFVMSRALTRLSILFLGYDEYDISWNERVEELEAKMTEKIPENII